MPMDRLSSTFSALADPTRRAILAFQKDHALVEDGRLTVGVANMLNTLLAQAPKINATTVASA